MDKESVIDRIVQSLSFEVEAIQQDNIVHISKTKNTTPFNVRIRVRKKNEPGLLHRGIVSVPKFRQSNVSSKEKVRLLRSDQTIMSFSLLLDADFEQKTIRKPRKHFLHLFKTGCLGTEHDNDETPYMPSTSDMLQNSVSKLKTVAEKHMEDKILLDKYDNRSRNKNTNDKSRKHKLFGKCKPGGCLDPPFSEDKYAYKPTKDQEKKDNVNFKEGNIDKPRINVTNCTLTAKKDKRSFEELKTTVTLFETATPKNSTETSYSNTIITYPPSVSSKILLTAEESFDKQIRCSSDNRKKLSNELQLAYYSAPKAKTTLRLEIENKNINNYINDKRCSSQETPKEKQKLSLLKYFNERTLSNKSSKSASPLIEENENYISKVRDSSRPETTATINYQVVPLDYNNILNNNESEHEKSYILESRLNPEISNNLIKKKDIQLGSQINAFAQEDFLKLTDLSKPLNTKDKEDFRNKDKKKNSITTLCEVQSIFLNDMKRDLSSPHSIDSLKIIDEIDIKKNRLNHKKSPTSANLKIFNVTNSLINTDHKDSTTEFEKENSIDRLSHGMQNDKRNSDLFLSSVYPCIIQHKSKENISSNDFHSTKNNYSTTNTLRAENYRGSKEISIKSDNLQNHAEDNKIEIKNLQISNQMTSVSNNNDIVHTFVGKGDNSTPDAHFLEFKGKQDNVDSYQVFNESPLLLASHQSSVIKIKESNNLCYISVKKISSSPNTIYSQDIKNQSNEVKEDREIGPKDTLHLKLSLTSENLCASKLSNSFIIEDLKNPITDSEKTISMSSLYYNSNILQDNENKTSITNTLRSEKYKKSIETNMKNNCLQNKPREENIVIKCIENSNEVKTSFIKNNVNKFVKKENEMIKIGISHDYSALKDTEFNTDSAREQSKINLKFANHELSNVEMKKSKQTSPSCKSVVSDTVIKPWNLDEMKDSQMKNNDFKMHHQTQHKDDLLQILNKAVYKKLQQQNSDEIANEDSLSTNTTINGHSNGKFGEDNLLQHLRYASIQTVSDQLSNNVTPIVQNVNNNLKTLSDGKKAVKDIFRHKHLLLLDSKIESDQKLQDLGFDEIHTDKKEEASYNSKTTLNLEDTNLPVSGNKYSEQEPYSAELDEIKNSGKDNLTKQSTEFVNSLIEKCLVIPNIRKIEDTAKDITNMKNSTQYSKLKTGETLRNSRENIDNIISKSIANFNKNEELDVGNTSKTDHSTVLNDKPYLKMTVSETIHGSNNNDCNSVLDPELATKYQKKPVKIATDRNSDNLLFLESSHEEKNLNQFSDTKHKVDKILLSNSSFHVISNKETETLQLMNITESQNAFVQGGEIVPKNDKQSNSINLQDEYNNKINAEKDMPFKIRNNIKGEENVTFTKVDFLGLPEDTSRVPQMEKKSKIPADENYLINESKYDFIKTELPLTTDAKQNFSSKNTVFHDNEAPITENLVNYQSFNENEQNQSKECNYEPHDYNLFLPKESKNRFSKLTDTKFDVSLSNKPKYNCDKHSSNENIYYSDVALELAFQSYVCGMKKVNVCKTIDTSQNIQRVAKDAITVIKSLMRLDKSNEIRVPINNNSEMIIHFVSKDNNIKVDNNKNTPKSTPDHSIQNIKDNTEQLVETAINKYKPSHNYRNTIQTPAANEMIIIQTVTSVYENQLLAFQNIIQNLKDDINLLAIQQENFRQNIIAMKKSMPVRLMQTNQKCGCLRK